MADEKQGDGGLDIWDVALPVGGALLVGAAARKLGRKALPYRGFLPQKARLQGMSDADLQKYPGSSMRHVAYDDIYERVGGKNIANMSPAQRKQLLKEMDEAAGYGRTGIARGTLTAGGAAAGAISGEAARDKFRKKK